MTTAQDKAIARSADHENLVGELVEALEPFVKAAEWAEQNGDSPRSALKHFLDATAYARIVLAHAKAEAQQ